MNIQELSNASAGGSSVLWMLQVLPLIAVLAIGLLKPRRHLILITLSFAVVELLLSIYLLLHFDQDNTAMQFAEHIDFGVISYHAAIDGVSVLFILMTSVLSLLVLIYAQVRELTPKAPLILVVFALQATLMSLFTTLDLIWFTLCSAIEVGLLGYLIVRWTTSPDSDTARARYYQFVGTGVLLFFIGVIMLGWNHADTMGGWTFDLITLAQTPVAPSIQSVIFFLLFYGLAIRIPLFPMHGWLPLVAEHGTLAVAPVFLIGLKVGIYGLYRFVLPLMPDAVIEWHQYVVAFAVAGVFYAATLAMLQDNLRRLLAFAVVSHTSILVIGLFSLNSTAFEGSLMLTMDFGLAITLLLFMIGLVYRRTRSVLLSRLGGLFDSIPLIGIAFLIGGLSIIGMPGTPGFDAAHLVLEASIIRFGALVTAAAALGNVVAAGFLLWAFQRAFLTPRPEDDPLKVESTTNAERLIIFAMILILLGAGFYSEPWLELIEQSTHGISHLYMDEAH